MAKKIPDIFKLTNPIYDENEYLWEMNERRMRGGLDVLCELRPFDWETLPNTADGLPSTEFDIGDVTKNLRLNSSANARPGDHYRFRQLMATYLNFPDLLATAMIGQLMARRPTPGANLDFGAMGKIGRKRDRNNPTDAELVYFNADGVGNDGSQWDNYWGGALYRAMATGHRWIYVDAPTRTTRIRSRMVAGNLRPYITDFSPLSAPQWVYEDGQLQQLTFMIPSRRIRMEGDELVGNDGDEDWLIMTRAGFTGFGNFFAEGGFWHVDPDGVVIKEGRWNRTKGEIPVFPLFFRRDYPTRRSQYPFSLNLWRRYRSQGPRSGVYRQAMSIPAITELANAAVGYMNLSSAADFDAWDAAASVQFLRGVDKAGYDLAMKKLQQGSRYVPLPANTEFETPQTPIVQDASMGATAATVFDLALKRKLDEVSRLAATQATQAPDSSGLSKSAGFGEAKVPRLALLASELEAAQNSALRFLELRFGAANPSAQVIWTRKFNLVELTDEIESFLQLEALAGIHDQELDAKALVMAARDKGLIIDDDEGSAALKRYQKVTRDTLLAPTPNSSVTSSTRRKRGLKGAKPAAKEILNAGG